MSESFLCFVDYNTMSFKSVLKRVLKWVQRKINVRNGSLAE